MQSSDVLDVKKWTERFCFFSFKRDAKVCSAGSQTQFKKPRRVLVESKDMQVSSSSIYYFVFFFGFFLSCTHIMYKNKVTFHFNPFLILVRLQSRKKLFYLNLPNIISKSV